MNTLRSAAIGTAGCAVSVAAFLFATGYVGDVEVSRRIDSGPPALLVAALAIDLLLLGLCVLTLWPGPARDSTGELSKSAACPDAKAGSAQQRASTVALAIARPVDQRAAPGSAQVGSWRPRPADRGRRRFPPLAPQIDPVGLQGPAGSPAPSVPEEHRGLATSVR